MYARRDIFWQFRDAMYARRDIFRQSRDDATYARRDIHLALCTRAGQVAAADDDVDMIRTKTIVDNLAEEQDELQRVQTLVQLLTRGITMG